MLRVNIVFGLLFVMCSSFAASFGVGNGNNGDKKDHVVDRTTCKEVSFDYEPWVKTARVGDYIVTKNQKGVTRRKEVIAIEADVVVVKTDDPAYRNGEQRYARKETPIASSELDMKKIASGTTNINNKTLKFTTYDGYLKLGGYSVGINGVMKEGFKAARYQKIIGEGVPFGGIIKELQAKNDGAPLPTNGSGRVNNKNNNLELQYEVIDFGNVNDEKAKK